jgi:CubicO group peptidase (beta-lactamase class C family)
VGSSCLNRHAGPSGSHPPAHRGSAVGPGFNNFCGICDSNAHVIGIYPPVYDSHRYFANTDYKGRYMKKVLGITLILAIAATAVAAEDDSATPTTIAELNATLEAVLDDTNTPGLIGTMVIGDEVIWMGTFGVADRETGRSVTPTTRFRVGSITKSFTSLAALILMERGKLSLDQPLHEFIPEAGLENRWRASDPIRLYHVLEHTAGFDDIHPREYAYSNADVTLLEGIEYNTTSRIARWRPGTRMSYSNIGPAVAALAIEKAAGEGFEDFVQREILDPLGMSRTSYSYHPDVAASYSADGKTPQPYMHIPVRPSGSMHATAADMAELLKMFIRRGTIDEGQLIEPSSLERMELPISTLSAQVGLPIGYGLSNASQERDRFHFQGHGGGIDGFISGYGYMPEHNRGYFLAINAGNGEALQRADKAIRGYLTRDLEPLVQSPANTGAPHVDLAGFYEPDAPRPELSRWIGYLTGTVLVTLDGNLLLIKSLFGEPSVWIPVGNGLFRRENSALASLAAVTTLDGEKLLQGQGTLKKIPAVVAWGRLLLALISVLLITSSLLFAVVWLFRRYALATELPVLSVRAWPAATSLCIVAVCVVVMVGQANSSIGKLTASSAGYWMLTLVYAAFALWSVANVWFNKDKRKIGRVVWWHSTAVAAANLLVLSYLGYYGMIGLRAWAY